MGQVLLNIIIWERKARRLYYLLGCGWGWGDGDGGLSVWVGVVGWMGEFTGMEEGG